MDSLSSSLATYNASGVWIRLVHSLSGAAGYGFSKRPISNFALKSLETAVSTVFMSCFPFLTSFGMVLKLLLLVNCHVVHAAFYRNAYNEPPPISTSFPAGKAFSVTVSGSIGLL